MEMIKLALLGNGMHNTFSRVFLALLGQTRPYLYLHQQGYCCAPGALGKTVQTLLICDCTQNRQAQLPFDLMILKDSFSGAVTDYTGTVLFNADRPGSFTLPSRGVVAVSYGLSEKNSVTVSSIETDSITVTVQRELTGLRGHSIEPQDFIFKAEVNRDSLSPYIAAAIVLQLL